MEKELTKLVNNLRSLGLSWTAHTNLLYVRNVIAKLLLRDWQEPLLNEFEDIGKISTSPEDLLTCIFGKHISPTLDEMLTEYDNVRNELYKRYKNSQLFYPISYQIEEAGSFLIYAMTRLARPSIILETGVANGHSSFIILSALNRNNKGLLYSVDICEKAGKLVHEQEKFRWRLEILNIWHPRSSFKDLLNSLGEIDLFIHDSEHSFSWQKFEYQSVLPKMSSHGIFMSDDVDASHAFTRFCEKLRIRPNFLHDKRKTLGCFSLSALSTRTVQQHSGRFSQRNSIRLFNSNSSGIIYSV